MENLLDIERPDSLSRVVKMALDTGEVATVGEGYALFAKYRMTVAVSPEAAHSPAHQAALLTMVNTGRRALLGGIQVAGDLAVPLLLPLPGLGATLAEAVARLGGRLAMGAAWTDAPLVRLGAGGGEGAPATLQVTFGDWRGGVFPAGEGERLSEEASAIPAAILAGALAVGEIFQRLRGNPMAAEREVGLSLWALGAPWRGAAGPLHYVVPSRLWILGLGHLGQAFLWVLGLLPYSDPGKVELTLQDFDRLALANDSTSVLTSPPMVGARKTREMGAWAEARGFSTRLVERRFDGDVRLQEDDPRVLFCGVDNRIARAALEDVGFDLVVEAGLGGGPQEYLAMQLHTFPGTVSARARWGDEVALARPSTVAPAYDDLARRGVDKCGLVELASRTVGAPFVGVVAAVLAVMEVTRRLNRGEGCEVLDLTLRDPALRRVVAGPRLRRFNPGFGDLAG